MFKQKIEKINNHSACRWPHPLSSPRNPTPLSLSLSLSADPPFPLSDSPEFLKFLS